MERVEFNLLKAEVEAQLSEIEKIYAEIDDRRKGARRSNVKLESLAYKLHNLYSAFEDLLKIIARYFENRVEDISRYHKELLKKMTLNIEGVRPPVLSSETYKFLDELRAFRHFFRHAYGYELKYEKIKPVLEHTDMLRDIYKKEVLDFLKKIEGEIV